jgi:K+-transporting ATPase ATPase C chain
MSGSNEPSEKSGTEVCHAKLNQQLRPAILSLVVFTLLAGCGFPLLLFAIVGHLFPRQASGSLVSRSGAVVGSELIGQEFTRPEYFHSRPSAAGAGYDGTSSGGTNLSPNNPKLTN